MTNIRDAKVGLAQWQRIEGICKDKVQSLDLAADQNNFMILQA